MSKSFVLRDESIRARLLAYLGGLVIDAEHPVEVIVRALTRPRSIPQNARYWHIINAICAHTGNNASTVHEYCKATFLGVDRYEFRGKVMEVPRSTTELNTRQFSDYTDQVEIWAAGELGLILEWDQRPEEDLKRVEEIRRAAMKQRSGG